MAGVKVVERTGNLIVLARAPVTVDARVAAVERLRRRVPRDGIVYAVRRTHDPSFGWVVVDFVLIDGCSVECITTDIAHALDCHDPEREVGVKLRRRASRDILGEAIGGRLSTLLFGLPDALRHSTID